MANALRSPLARLAAICAAALLFLVMSAGIATLGGQVFRQITSLNTAKSDNLQWTLAQIEVEFLSFSLELTRVQSGQTQDLRNLRRWFDIFYSRIDTIRTGQLYNQLAARQRLAPAFAHLDRFLSDTAALIDGPDAQLIAALPDMAEKAAYIRPDVRAVSLEGIRVFSRESDVQRQSVSDTMLRIASLTLGLVALLLLCLFWLLRLYRFGRAQTQETRQTGDRLQAMLNTSLDAVLVVDREGRFLEFNGAASEIFGYTQAEALGQQMTDLIFPPHLIAAHNAGMRRHLETGHERVIGKGRIQIEGRRKSGELFPVELSIAKTMSPQGEIFVSYLRDISDRREAEEILLKARDDALAGERAKSRFIAVMSHEMRTPLNGLLGSLDLLKSTQLDAKQAQFADMMHSSGQLLLHHVNDVLDIARLEGGNIGGEMRNVDLGALMDEVLESQAALARTKGLGLRYDRPQPDIGSVTTSGIGLRQVLLNLVNNAIKFTDKGAVTLGATITADGARLRIWVQDTGLGIESKDLTRIFDDFVTLDSSFGRKADGTGLGLGIARRLVQAMGGEIGVDSTAKVGSTFWLEIPYQPAAALVPPDLPANAPPRSSSKMDVLIVEDNQINRFILREMLQADGHRVTEAQDGLAGLTLAKQRRFDAIFMDISMPRLDGIDATAQLRASNGASAMAPIIALTAHALPEDRDLFLASGMNAVLTKPIDRKLMLQVLAQTAACAPIHAPAATHVMNNALDELVAVLGMDKVQALGARFMAEGDQAMPQITALFDGGDLVGAQAAIHALAGSSATFGAVSLQKALAGMESDLKSGHPEGARAALACLGLIWTSTKAEFSRRLAG